MLRAHQPVFHLIGKDPYEPETLKPCIMPTKPLLQCSLYAKVFSIHVVSYIVNYIYAPSATTLTRPKLCGMSSAARLSCKASPSPSNGAQKRTSALVVRYPLCPGDCQVGCLLPRSAFRLMQFKRHWEEQPERALFREMVVAFASPAWAIAGAAGVR